MLHGAALSPPVTSVSAQRRSSRRTTRLQRAAASGPLPPSSLEASHSQTLPPSHRNTTTTRLSHHAPLLASQMTDRRASAAPSPKIPPAPPPPPPKHKQRSYFERFVAQPLTTAYASRPPSVQTNRPDGGPPNPLVPKLPGYVGVPFRPVCTSTPVLFSSTKQSPQHSHRIFAGCQP